MTFRTVFCTHPAIASAAIRVITFSPWSHEAIVDGDYIIEATGEGVHRRPLEDALAGYTDYAIAEWPVPNPEAALQFARDQIGKPYDYGAISWQLFGRVLVPMGIERDWSSDQRWFCCELVEASSRQGGLAGVRGAPSLISPNDRWESTQYKLITPPRGKAAKASLGI